MRGLVPSRYPSPLRYPGGKGKVANYVKLLLLQNDMLGVDYVEPYAGGASVGLSLLFEDYASTIHINDLNRSVHAFWHAALYQTDELCALIRTARLEVDEWERQRALQDDLSVSGLQLGFSTFYLNRTNRSGIISGGGVIGGKAQDGTWKIDARFNREDLIQRIRKVSRFSSRIRLTRSDAYELLSDLSTVEPDGSTFVYLDPPYFVKGEGLYDNFYEPSDHRRIAEAVQDLSCPWLISYDAAPQILDLYKAQRSLRYSLLHTASSTRLGSEVMFFSPELILPDSNTAAGISADQVGEVRRLLLNV